MSGSPQLTPSRLDWRCTEATGSPFVCETLSISGDPRELDPRFRTGQGLSLPWTGMSVQRCPQPSGVSAKWITMNGAFVAKSRPLLGSLSMAPVHGSRFPQNNNWISALLYQALTPRKGMDL